MGTKISGKDGTIKISTTVQPLITGWEATMSVETTRSADNESSGATTSTPGVFSADGTIEGWFNSAAATSIGQGVQVTLLLYVNATLYYTAPCTIKSMKVGKVDIARGGLVPFVATIENNGAWTAPTY